MSFYIKNPLARVDYAVTWAPAFLGNASIAESQWQVTPDEAGGVVIDDSSVEGVKTAAVLSGGLSGKTYRVGNIVTLSDGRRDARMLTLRVEER